MQRLFFVFVIVLAGCAEQVVRVRDETGKPVEGARVIVVKPALNAVQGETDKKGEIEIVSEGLAIRIEKLSNAGKPTEPQS